MYSIFITWYRYPYYQPGLASLNLILKLKIPLYNTTMLFLNLVWCIYQHTSINSACCCVCLSWPNPLLIRVRSHTYTHSGPPPPYTSHDTFILWDFQEILMNFVVVAFHSNQPRDVSYQLGIQLLWSDPYDKHVVYTHLPCSVTHVIMCMHLHPL